MYKRILSLILAFLIIGAFALPVNIYASYPVMILKGGYVAHVVGFDKNGRAMYQVNLASPTYCDDLKTPIDTQWHEQKDGTFKSGDNKYSATVSSEQITVANGAEYIKWTPDIVLEGANKGVDKKLKSLKVKAEILDVDPMNENYHKNTLVWHYENGVDRYFRLIEGQCQEYFVINSELGYDLKINPNAIQTKNFKNYEKAVAYDDVGTGIKLTEDQNKNIKIKSSSVKETSVTKGKMKSLVDLYDGDIKEAQQTAISNGQEPEVKYPIVIDPNYTFVSSSADGFCYGLDSVYNTAWTNTTASAIDVASNYSRIGQANFSGFYEVDRSALYFDTSVLTSVVTITGVDLKIYGYVDQSVTDFNITLQQGSTTYPHDPLVVGDYDKTNYTTTSVGVFGTAGFITSDYNTLSFNAADFAMINKVGVTKLLLRSSLDIAGTAPSGYERIWYYTYEKGNGYWPQLIVTFTAATPSITTLPASTISKTTAQLNANITDDGGEVAGSTEVRFGYGTKSLLNVGTFANNTGTATPTGAILSGGFTEAVYRTTTHTVTIAGTFDITLPAGVTGTARSGTATLAGSPVALGAGATTTVDTGVTVGDFTVEIITVYDVVSPWVSGWEKGDNVPLSVTGLTGSTTYYFRSQVRNTTATVSSTNQLSFLTANAIDDVTYFTGLPSNTSISLNWQRPTGASQVLIRYGDASCPATVADGTLVYLNTSSSYVHTGLTAGKTYYYSIWGEDAGSYSTNPKTLTLTTLGVSITSISGGDALPNPNLPSSFFAPLNNTALQNFEPFYSIINDFAISWGVPANTMWLIIVLVAIAFIGVIILIETRHLMPAVFVSSILMLGASFMQLLPGYFIAIAIMVALGAWGLERNQ